MQLYTVFNMSAYLTHDNYKLAAARQAHLYSFTSTYRYNGSFLLTQSLVIRRLKSLSPVAPCVHIYGDVGNFTMTSSTSWKIP